MFGFKRTEKLESIDFPPDSMWVFLTTENILTGSFIVDIFMVLRAYYVIEDGKINGGRQERMSVFPFRFAHARPNLPWREALLLKKKRYDRWRMVMASRFMGEVTLRNWEHHDAYMVPKDAPVPKHMVPDDIAQYADGFDFDLRWETLGKDEPLGADHNRLYQYREGLPWRLKVLESFVDTLYAHVIATGQPEDSVSLAAVQQALEDGAAAVYEEERERWPTLFRAMNLEEPFSGSTTEPRWGPCSLRHWVDHRLIDYLIEDHGYNIVENYELYNPLNFNPEAFRFVGYRLSDYA